MYLPQAIKDNLKSIVVIDSAPVGGGDINQSALLHGEDGRRLFIKYNRSEQAGDMLRTEMLGLHTLGRLRVIQVANPLEQGSVPGGWSYLLLDYIEQARPQPGFWERFGAELAALHQITDSYFGLGYDNFIGSLPQRNARHETWNEFYANERLLPQMRLARISGLLQHTDELKLKVICNKLTELCPEEPPSMVHGDLWSGNFLCSADNQPVLIDPAVSYAHREMDLAMSRLFGGFSPLFYKSYHEAYPLQPGFEQRLELYQLYYLLVHVNLFGGGYVESVRAILKKFG